MNRLFKVPTLIELSVFGLGVIALSGCGSEELETTTVPTEAPPVLTTAPTAPVTAPTGIVPALTPIAPAANPASTPAAGVASTESIPTPQEVAYMANYKKVQELIDKSLSRPDYLQNSASLAASKAEIDSAYNTLISVLPIPPRFTTFHQYLFQALSKHRQLLTMQSFHLSQGNQYLKGPEELKATGELYRLAGEELKRISEATKGKITP